MDSNVVRIKSLDMPESSPKKSDKPVPSDIPETVQPPLAEGLAEIISTEEITEVEGIEVAPTVEEPVAAPTNTPGEQEKKGNGKKSELSEPWPESFNTALAPFLSEEAIAQMKQMFLEGPEPPRVSDSGWGTRPTNPEGSAPESAEASSAPEAPQEEPEKQGRGRRGRERGGRGAKGGRGGGRGGRAGGQREDTRKVLSNVRVFKPCLLLSIPNDNLTLDVDSPCRTRLLALRCIRRSGSFSEASLKARRILRPLGLTKVLGLPLNGLGVAEGLGVADVEEEVRSVSLERS